MICDANSLRMAVEVGELTQARFLVIFKKSKATIHYDFIVKTLLIDRPLAFDELPLMFLAVQLCIKCQFLILYKTQLIR